MKTANPNEPATANSPKEIERFINKIPAKKAKPTCARAFAQPFKRYEIVLYLQLSLLAFV